MRLKAAFAEKPQDRTDSPTLSFDSGSGDDEGPQLGIGVKTHAQKISDEVTVNYPIQCQVNFVSTGGISIYMLYIHSMSGYQ